MRFEVLTFLNVVVCFCYSMGPRSCIGTTDTRVTDLPPIVSDEDRHFILDNINKRLCLDNPLTKDDIIAERCGVRPLVVESDGDDDGGDWLNLSRKHAIEVDKETRLISIFGGKLTDCINVGEEVVEEISKLDIDLPSLRNKWFGEPDEAVWKDLRSRLLIGQWIY